MIDHRKLRQALDRKHMTQRALSAATGLSAAYVADLLAGRAKKQPSPYTLLAIARALGVEPDELCAKVGRGYGADQDD